MQQEEYKMNLYKKNEIPNANSWKTYNVSSINV